jgi:hypothetical protein
VDIGVQGENLDLPVEKGCWSCFRVASCSQGRSRQVALVNEHGNAIADV